MEKITLGLLNVNGLRNKTNFIQNLILTHNIKVLGLCGTRLDDSIGDDNIRIEGFQVQRKDRDSHGGGVAIYAQKDIRYERRNDLIHQDVEIICVEFSLPGKKPMLVACCYSPRDKKNYVNGICNVMKQLSKEGKEKDIFLMGTFHTERYRDPEKERQLEQVANECGLTQIVAENCRALNERTRMDHIYTNVPEICGPTERISPTSADDQFDPVIPDQDVGPVKSSAGQFSDHGLFYVTVSNRPK